MNFSRTFLKTDALPARIDTVPSLPRDTKVVFEYGIVTSRSCLDTFRATLQARGGPTEAKANRIEGI